MENRNFLILCSDEHAPRALSCLGHPTIKTPVLDSLAARGTVFDRAYSPSPICVPARACLATGQHVHETKCWSSAEPYHGQHRSWMHDLRDAGRNVTSIGKLHFRSGLDDNGFSEEILPMYLANDGKGWPQGLIRDPMPGFPEAAEMAKDVGPGESTYTNYDKDIAELTVDWLRKPVAQDPWTLFVSFVSPHYPLTAPQEFFDLYKDVELPEPIVDQLIDKHPVLREMRKFWDYDDYFDVKSRDLAVRSYFGLCSFLDHNIGRVISALEETGQLDNTVILYISDHGEMLGNHGFWAKSVMYEDSVGIPMIIAGPDIPQGINTTPVNLVDVAATARQTAGIEYQSPDEDWQSTSLVDLAKAPDSDRFTFSQYHDGGSPTGFYMIRRGDWKYVYYTKENPCQLFNMTEDPHELNDLGDSETHTAIRAEMHELLCRVVEPESVNEVAFADQEKAIAANGGKDAILNLPSFNHTPVGG
ncbi:MAG: sulfatase-like hydrolase/transferase [Pseudomonadota bacterium]